MNTTHPVGSAGQHRRHGQAAVAGVPLKVFIGYADLEAARRAMATVASTVRAARRPIEIEPMMWRFCQLESSHWRDRAITAAMNADVIVLATSTPGLVSGELERWVDHFLAANRGRKATIVAIAGSSDAWTISIEHTVKPAAGSAFPANPVSSEALVA